jgi:hypothetical protein
MRLAGLGFAQPAASPDAFSEFGGLRKNPRLSVALPGALYGCA